MRRISGLLLILFISLCGGREVSNNENLISSSTTIPDLTTTTMQESIEDEILLTDDMNSTASSTSTTLSTSTTTTVPPTTTTTTVPPTTTTTTTTVPPTTTTTTSTTTTTTTTTTTSTTTTTTTVPCNLPDMYSTPGMGMEPYQPSRVNDSEGNFSHYSQITFAFSTSGENISGFKVYQNSSLYFTGMFANGWKDDGVWGPGTYVWEITAYNDCGETDVLATRTWVINSSGGGDF